MKTFRGRKTEDVYVVTLEDNESHTTILSLVKSLQVVDHSREGFQWGHSGSGPAQLSAAILYEVTSDADIARQYYRLFLSDYVERWECTFEINESQVNRWLRRVGAKINRVERDEIVDMAKTQFEQFHHLYKKAKHAITTEEEHVIEMIPLCESAILLSRAWIQEYEHYIQALDPPKYGTTREGYKWMPMLEGIRDQLSLFIDLLYDQQLDHDLLKVAEQVKRETVELLTRHIYFNVFL